MNYGHAVFDEFFQSVKNIRIDWYIIKRIFREDCLESFKNDLINTTQFSDVSFVHSHNHYDRVTPAFKKAMRELLESAFLNKHITDLHVYYRPWRDNLVTQILREGLSRKTYIRYLTLSINYQHVDLDTMLKWNKSVEFLVIVEPSPAAHRSLEKLLKRNPRIRSLIFVNQDYHTASTLQLSPKILEKNENIELVDPVNFDPPECEKTFKANIKRKRRVYLQSLQGMLPPDLAGLTFNYISDTF